jgi:hypothetical protein
VVDSSNERDFGWFKRVFLRELDVQEEDSLLVRRVFWTYDSCIPVITVFIVLRASGTVGRRVTLEVL